MKNIILLFALSLTLLNSCGKNNSCCSKKDNKTECSINKTSVPFTTAANYFVLNSYKVDALTPLKITSPIDFHAVFGMATTMGSNGKPTAIDFSKQYVIALIHEETNQATTLQVEKLTLENQNLKLHYKETNGSMQTHTSKPFTMIIVDNTFNGNLTIHNTK